MSTKRSKSNFVDQDINKDLGLGSRVADQSKQRFLNQDGSFNVRRRHLSFFRSLSLYHHLLNISWFKFFVLMAVSYFVVNMLFAAGYVLCGPDSLHGIDSSTLPKQFIESFFFSVQTSATIGYGRISPNGFGANLLVTFEAFTGLFGFALATGLLFARFSKPQAKILYSKHAIIAPYKDINALEFRLANERSNELIKAHISVTLAMNVAVDGKSKRMFYPLKLERNAVEFLPLHWVVVHPIDESSPMSGMTKKDLDECDAEILILLSSIDETFAQTVHSRTSYKYFEVVWGAKFQDMFLQSDGFIGIDLFKIHNIEPVPLNPILNESAKEINLSSSQ